MSCKLKELLANIKLIDYTYKYKKKAYNPVKIINNYIKDWLDVNKPNNFKELFIDTDGNFKLDLFSVANLSTLDDIISFTKENKLNTDLLKDSDFIVNIDKDTTLSISGSMQKAIAIDFLLKSIPEYINKAKKNYLNVDKHLRDSEGNIKFNKNQLAYVIGREIYLKSGLVVTGKDRVNIYLTKGLDILNKLESTGIIKTKKGYIQTFNMFNTEGGKFGYGDLKDIKELPDKDITVFNTEYFTDNINKLLQGRRVKIDNKTYNNIYDYYSYIKEKY